MLQETLSDLGLGVGTRPPEGAVAPEVAHLPVERVREDDGEGHALLSLVGRVAEHETLEDDDLVRVCFDVFYFFLKITREEKRSVLAK